MMPNWFPFAAGLVPSVDSRIHIQSAKPCSMPGIEMPEGALTDAVAPPPAEPWTGCGAGSAATGGGCGRRWPVCVPVVASS
jgi:hypothetical protein